MDQALYQNHLGILREELLVALGCTEPIAIAYAGAKARQLLGVIPEHYDSMHITCSDHTAFLFVQKKRTFHPPSCLRIDHGFDRSGAGCFQRQFHSEN